MLESDSITRDITAAARQFAKGFSRKSSFKSSFELEFLLSLCPSSDLERAVRRTSDKDVFFRLFSNSRGAPFSPCNIENYYKYLLFLASIEEGTNPETETASSFSERKIASEKTKTHEKLLEKLEERKNVNAVFDLLKGKSAVVNLDSHISTLVDSISIEKSSRNLTSLSQYVVHRLLNGMLTASFHRVLISTIVLNEILRSKSSRIQEVISDTLRNFLKPIATGQLGSDYEGLKPSLVFFNSMFVVCLLMNGKEKTVKKEDGKLVFAVLEQVYAGSPLARVWTTRFFCHLISSVSSELLLCGLSFLQKAYFTPDGMQRIEINNIGADAICIYLSIRSRLKKDEHIMKEIPQDLMPKSLDVFHPKKVQLFTRNLLQQNQLWKTYPDLHPVFHCVIMSLMDEKEVLNIIEPFIRVFFSNFPDESLPQRAARQTFSNSLCQEVSKRINGYQGNRVLSEIMKGAKLSRLPTLRPAQGIDGYGGDGSLREIVSRLLEQYVDASNPIYLNQEDCSESPSIDMDIDSDDSSTQENEFLSHMSLRQPVCNTFAEEIRAFVVRQVVRSISLRVPHNRKADLDSAISVATTFFLMNIILQTNQSGVDVDNVLIAPSITSEQRASLLNHLSRILNYQSSTDVDSKIKSTKDHRQMYCASLDLSLPDLLDSFFRWSGNVSNKAEVAYPNSTMMRHPKIRSSLLNIYSSSGSCQGLAQLLIVTLLVNDESVLQGTDIAQAACTIIETFPKNSFNESVDLLTFSAFSVLYESGYKILWNDSLRNCLDKALESYFSTFLCPKLNASSVLHMLSPSSSHYSEDTANTLKGSNVQVDACTVSLNESTSLTQEKVEVSVNDGKSALVPETFSTDITLLNIRRTKLCGILFKFPVKEVGYIVAMRWLRFIEVTVRNQSLKETMASELRHFLSTFSAVKPNVQCSTDATGKNCSFFVQSLSTEAARILQSRANSILRNPWIKEGALSLISTLHRADLCAHAKRILGEFFTQLLFSDRMGAALRHVLNVMRNNSLNTALDVFPRVRDHLEDLMKQRSNCTTAPVIQLQKGALCKRDLQCSTRILDFFNEIYRNLLSMEENLRRQSESHIVSILSLLMPPLSTISSQRKLTEQAFSSNESKDLLVPLLQSLLPTLCAALRRCLLEFRSFYVSLTEEYLQWLENMAFPISPKLYSNISSLTVLADILLDKYELNTASHSAEASHRVKHDKKGTRKASNKDTPNTLSMGNTEKRDEKQGQNKHVPRKEKHKLQKSPEELQQKRNHRREIIEKKRLKRKAYEAKRQQSSSKTKKRKRVQKIKRR